MRSRSHIQGEPVREELYRQRAREAASGKKIHDLQAPHRVALRPGTRYLNGFLMPSCINYLGGLYSVVSSQLWG